jgi:hypothetical protein
VASSGDNITSFFSASSLTLLDLSPMLIFYGRNLRMFVIS